MRSLCGFSFWIFVHVSVYGVDSPPIVRLVLEHFESGQFLTFTCVFLIVDEASPCSTVCSVILYSKSCREPETETVAFELLKCVG